MGLCDDECLAMRMSGGTIAVATSQGLCKYGYFIPCIMVSSIELCTFMSVSVTLIKCQGQNSVGKYEAESSVFLTSSYFS